MVYCRPHVHQIKWGGGDGAVCWMVTEQVQGRPSGKVQEEHEQASASAAREVSPEHRRWGGAGEPAPPGPRGKGLRGARVRSGGPAFRPGESQVELGSASKYSGVLGEFLEERTDGGGQRRQIHP